MKFNLLREENEGYAKLITELYENHSRSASSTLTILYRLIGCPFFLRLKKIGMPDSSKDVLFYRSVQFGPKSCFGYNFRVIRGFSAKEIIFYFSA